MKINTKVVFEWNDDTKQYEEIYCESYEYDGEVAECQNEDEEGIIVVLPPVASKITDITEFLNYFKFSMYMIISMDYS